MRRHLSRGAGLAETAIVLSFTMLLLLGTMQVALLSFYQVQLDGGTFFYAQQYSAGATNQATLAGTLQRLFPSIVTSSIVEAPMPPPNTNEPVNYTQWGNQTLRYGGASLIRPQRLGTSINLTSGAFSLLGSSVKLYSGNVDGRLMVGNHDDDAQGLGYNSPGVYASMFDPLLKDDQNVPPYYFNIADMRYCGSWVSQATQGLCSGVSLETLGMAEFLKDDNYNKNVAAGVGPGGPFYLMGCHQRVYAAIGAFLFANPARPASTKPSDFAGNSDWNETPSGPMVASSPLLAPYSFRLVYAWDQATHPKVVGKGFYGQFSPLHPEIGC